MSREHQFLSVTSEELEEQLRYFADAYPRNTPIWFVGANPLVLPTATLLAHIALVRRYFPDFAAITLQTRPNVPRLAPPSPHHAGAHIRRKSNV